jgi:predicted amidophosphoribosyltransferase
MGKVYKSCQKPGCPGAELGFLWDNEEMCPRCGSRLRSADEQVQEAFQKLAAVIPAEKNVEQIAPRIKDNEDWELVRAMNEAVRITFPELTEQGSDG